MGKLKQFKIVFDQNQIVYFPGNVITGHVDLDLDSALEMSVVKLKFMGKARVHWSEGSDKNRRHYNASQVLFEHYVILQGGEEGGATDRRGELHPGKHVYPFNFQIPDALPSSFEDCVGSIRYYAKCSIVMPWKFDHNTKQAFTVLDVLDLNAMSNMMAPSSDSETKTLCCWCCSSGPITGNIQVDRTGYVPGEWVTFNASLTNKSNSNIEKISVDVIQMVSYITRSKTKILNKTMSTKIGPGCRRRDSVSWNNERIQIPPVPPSESQHCSIIDITYFIQLQAHLRTCAINLRAKAPVIIGTVPLRSLEMYSNDPPNPYAEASAPAIQPNTEAPPSYAGPASSTAYSTMPPPPTYAMATDGGINIKDDDDNDDTMGEMNYTPQYTYYDWSESAFTYGGGSQPRK